MKSNLTSQEHATLAAISERLRGGAFIVTPELKACAGKTIVEMTFMLSTLYILFDDSKLAITNDDPDCCANKYLVCDDALDFASGRVFQGLLRKTAPANYDYSGSNDAHEIAFGEIVTSGGVVQLTAHNEHNGYYGGIDFAISLTDL